MIYLSIASMSSSIYDNVLFLRMKPVSLLVALLLIGLAAAEDYDDEYEDYGDDIEGRKGAGVKGACKRTGPKPTENLFKPYTIPIKNKSNQSIDICS